MDGGGAEGGELGASPTAGTRAPREMCTLKGGKEGAKKKHKGCLGDEAGGSCRVRWGAWRRPGGRALPLPHLPMAV